MQSGQASRTALGAAGHRAAHQVLEQGRIFSDPLALRILGADADEAIAEAVREPAKRGLRLFIAVRTRFAEDALAEAIGRGATQLVVLGAGLDTYAYRAHRAIACGCSRSIIPHTQAWKRERLASASIAIPDALTFAPVDFERENLAEGLAAAGFDPVRRSFFTWLGVTPYLERGGGFRDARAHRGPAGRRRRGVRLHKSARDDRRCGAARLSRNALPGASPPLAKRSGARFDTRALHDRVRALGFQEIEDLGPAEIAARYFPERAGTTSGGGGHILRAATR